MFWSVFNTRAKAQNEKISLRTKYSVQKNPPFSFASSNASVLLRAEEQGSSL